MGLVSAGAFIAALPAQAVNYFDVVADGATMDKTAAPYIITPSATDGGISILGAGIGLFGQLTVTTTSVQGDGINISIGAGGTLDIAGGNTVATRSSVATSGDGAVGIRVLNNALLTLSNTDIATAGKSGAHGLVMAGDGEATLTNVTIKTNSTAGSALDGFGHNVGMYVAGGSQVEMTGGSIETKGVFVAYGVEVLDADSHATLTDVAVKTTGADGSTGIRLNNTQMNQATPQPPLPSGSGSVTLIRGSVTTTGIKSAAIHAQIYSQLKIDGTVIRTSGDQASGIVAEGSTKVVIDNADIKTTGASAFGIMVAGELDIKNTKIETGTRALIGGKNNAAGIYIISDVAVVKLDAVTINTLGKNSPGIWYNVTPGGTGRLTVNNSDIAATNNASHGLAIYGGVAIVSGSRITVTGSFQSINPIAVMANSGGSVTLTGNTIKTTGSGAQGVASMNNSSVDVIGGSVTTTGGSVSHGLIVEGSSRLTTDGTAVSTAGTLANALIMRGAAANVNTAEIKDTTLNAVNSAINIESGTGNLKLTGATTAVTGDGTWLQTGASAVANVSVENSAQVNGQIESDPTATSSVSIKSGAAWNISGTSTVTNLSFDGGILRYMTNGATNISSTNLIKLNAGGMLADTNGFDNQISQVLSGTGGLTKIGQGTLTLQAANIYAGTTRVQTGTLLIGDLVNRTASVAGPALVDSGAILSGLGSVAGVVTNNGTVAAWNAVTGHEADPVSNFTLAAMVNQGEIKLAGSTVGNTLTVTGGYIGNGSLVINTVLGDDRSLTDRLILNGGTATGLTAISVINVGGLGAQTLGDGIKVVDAINGATTATGAFTLSGRVAAGLYEYTLRRGGTEGSDNWYLTSAIPPAQSGPASTTSGQNIRPEIAVNAAIMPLAAEYGFAVLGTLHERIGDSWLRPLAPIYEDRVVRCKDRARNNQCIARSPSTPALSEQPQWFAGAWGRLFADYGERNNGGWLLSHGPSYDYTLSGIQAGLDILGRQTRDGSLDKAGIYMAYGQLSGDVERAWGGGKGGTVDFDAYTVGAYWTHRAASGWYTDAVAQSTWYATTASSVLGEQVKPDGWGALISLEGGYAFDLGGGFKIEPQAQLAYQYLTFEDSRDTFGKFSYADVNGLRGRIGVRLAKTWMVGESARPRLITSWVRANVWHDFSDDARMQARAPAGSYSGDIDTPLGGTWGEVSAGVSGQISDAVSLFATGAYNHSLDGKDREGWNGRLGMNVRW